MLPNYLLHLTALTCFATLGDVFQQNIVNTITTAIEGWAQRNNILSRDYLDEKIDGIANLIRQSGAPQHERQDQQPNAQLGAPYFMQLLWMDRFTILAM